MSTILVAPAYGRMRQLTFRDYFRFQSFLAQRKTCYANGWLYHLRSSRNQDGSLGFSYHFADYFATVGMRQTFSTCVSPMGENRFSQTPALCKWLRRKTGRPVVLKKVDAELYEHLIAQPGFFECDDGRFLEDENFAEHSLDLKTLFDAQGKLNRKARQLARRLRQFKQSGTELSISDLRELRDGDLRKLLNQVCATFPAKRKAYAEICRFLQAGMMDSSRFFLRAFFDRSQRIHGLYIAERLGAEKAGLYCAVTSREHAFATEWMDVQFFRALGKTGARQLLLGGSETAGVHHYVQKLLPRPTNSGMRPLVFRASRFQNELAEDKYSDAEF